MTYGYGENMHPDRRGQHWDERGGATESDASTRGSAWPRQGPPEPSHPSHGEGHDRSRRYAQGSGGPLTTQGYQTEPPAGFRPSDGDPAMRGHIAQRSAPYRGGEHAGPMHDGTPTQYSGEPGQYGVGTRRGPEPYESDRYRPQPTFDEPSRANAEAKPQHRSGKLLVFAIILVVLVIGGGGWYYLHRDSGSPVALVNPPNAAQARNVVSQQVDPDRLTTSETFGAGMIPSAASGGSYKVIKAQATTDCATAVGGDITTILTTAGCTQVVRATLMSPDGDYVITAGIFNLSDETAAGKAATAINTDIETQKGRLSGLVAGGSTDLIGRAATNVAWDIRGHYLMYCVIADAHSRAIAANDSHTHLIFTDVVESYLGGVVIHKRETGASTVPQTSTSPS